MSGCASDLFFVSYIAATQISKAKSIPGFSNAFTIPEFQTFNNYVQQFENGIRNFMPQIEYCIELKTTNAP